MTIIRLRCLAVCMLLASVGWAQTSSSPVIRGTGTADFVPIFTGTETIGNSEIFHSASISPNGYLNLVGIGTTFPDGTLHINVAPRKNAFDLGDFFAGSFLIRDTSPGFIDIQTFNSDLAMQCCSDNGNIFMFPSGSNGHLGIGTSSAPNIITVKQNSATEPIADAWTTYSSARWKTNIRPLRRALDKVVHLRGVSFDWRANGKHDIGMVAEEVAPVVPEVVAFEQNGKDAKSVDYGRLTALLVEAIKEQQNEIRELRAQVEKLSYQRTGTSPETRTGTN